METSADAAARRSELYDLLGDLPSRESELQVTLLATEQHGSYTVERLLFDFNGREGVPGIFVRPAGSEDDRLPVVLYNHAHGGNYVLGKSELLEGRSALWEPPYAEVLTSMGFAALCIDMWGFGERRGRTLDSLFKEMLWKGEVLWGRNVYDNLRMIDYLTSRPDVDSRRIATMGISMGSTIAWWTAALDERITVCIDLCCLTDYQALIDHDGLDGHDVAYYVPKLLQHFSTAQINALIAPRAHLSLAGNYDPLTPREGLDRIDRELRREYEALGAGEAWRLMRYECGHFETAAMRAEVIDFLRKWL